MCGFASSYARPLWLRSKVTPLSLLALLSSAASHRPWLRPPPNNPARSDPLIVTAPKRKPVQRVQTDAGRSRVHARVTGRTRTRPVNLRQAPYRHPARLKRRERRSTPMSWQPARAGLGSPCCETPASVEIVDQQTMREQGYRTTTETAQGAVGVLSGDAGRRARPAFPCAASPAARSISLYNGIWIGPQDITSRVMDTANLDRVEFLKGPSSLMSGLDAIGGSVNYVTQAADQRRRSRTNSTLRSIRSEPIGPISARAAARRSMVSIIAST